MQSFGSEMASIFYEINVDESIFVIAIRRFDVNLRTIRFRNFFSKRAMSFYQNKGRNRHVLIVNVVVSIYFTKNDGLYTL